MEDQDGRTNRQIQEQKRALKKLPWKRKESGTGRVRFITRAFPRAFPPQWKAGLIHQKVSVEQSRIHSEIESQTIYTGITEIVISPNWLSV